MLTEYILSILLTCVLRINVLENVLGVAGRADAEDFQSAALLDDLLVKLIREQKRQDEPAAK